MVVGGVAVVAMSLHLIFFGAPLAPDEGGYLLVARQWHGGGSFLYGHLWVDRPPLLLVLFGLAGGAVGVHLVAALCSGVVVVAAGWAGWAVAGNVAARWSALVAGAFSASGLLSANELDGELLAIPFVLLSCALILHAWYRPGRGRYLCAGAAGVAAVSALMVKQNFVEGIVFATVLLGMHGVRSSDRHGAVRMAAAFLTGVAGSFGVVAVWAASQGKLGALWFATVTFRAKAGAVIQAGSWHAPQGRLIELLWVSVFTGVLALVVVASIAHFRELRRGDPLIWALGAGVAVELAGIALGGSFWVHYLLGVIPMLSLAVGVAVARGTSWQTKILRAIVVLACALTVVATPIIATNLHLFGNRGDRVGAWLGRASIAGDTAFVTYSHPNILYRAGLSSPYPYVWSLPVRTLDPKLALLTKTVGGPTSPTWIVEWEKFNTWQLDSRGTFATLVQSRYRVVGMPCGHPVWLRNDVKRTIPASLGC